MIDYIKNNHITESQMYYTRRCNSRCGACNLPFSGEKLKELNKEQWIIVMKNLQRLDIKTVKLMGGEPTEQKDLTDLLDLISFTKNNTDIRLALLSNSKWDKAKWFDKICTSGLYGYYASVDTINEEALCYDTLEKSQKGYKMLLDLKEYSDIPILAANVVISKKNYKNLPSLIKLLSNKDLYVNICPLQCYINAPSYNQKPVEYHFRKNKNPNMLTKEDLPELEKVLQEIIKLKQHGAKVAVPSQYILDIPKYGLYGGTWQCSMFSQLRVDSDGTIMICNEFRGERKDLPNLSYNIEDIEKWNKDFIDYWYTERPKYNCSCYWSCFLQAENNIKIGSTEFGFYENPLLHEIGTDINNSLS